MISSAVSSRQCQPTSCVQRHAAKSLPVRSERHSQGTNPSPSTHPRLAPVRPHRLTHLACYPFGACRSRASETRLGPPVKPRPHGLGLLPNRRRCGRSSAVAGNDISAAGLFGHRRPPDGPDGGVALVAVVAQIAQTRVRFLRGLAPEQYVETVRVLAILGALEPLNEVMTARQHVINGAHRPSQVQRSSHPLWTDIVATIVAGHGAGGCVADVR
jgi:hypothetical protein